MSQCPIPIVLVTANARYPHCAFGLKRLWSSLGALRDQAKVLEFTIQESPVEIAEHLLSFRPRIIGFGVYIWNADLLTQAAQAIRQVQPEIALVAGGPEVHAEEESATLYNVMDYCVIGEGEDAFAGLAADLLNGQCRRGKTIRAAKPELERLANPYRAYTREDLKNRIVYVESSRGCPFHCSFCLSANDHPVRYFPLEPFLASLGQLIEDGARRIKFVDRTFNLQRGRVMAILDRLSELWRPGLQAHFEIMPHLLDETVLQCMRLFPENALHLEVGLQTVTPSVQESIGRNQAIDDSLEWIRRLRTETGAFLHADLLAGLPGETLESFALAFDALLATGPHEIQVGVLKRLKGAPIARETGPGWAFAPFAPYEALYTPRMSFEDIQRIKHFARFFEIFYNSGNLRESLGLLWQHRSSPFNAFLAFSDWLWEQTGRTHRIALAQAAEFLFQHLADRDPLDRDIIGKTIEREFRRLPGRRDRLNFSH